MSDIEFNGTGGIIEGNLGLANVNVNLDRSLMFDGTNDFIDCGTDTDHDFTDHFTLACWAKNDNATTTGGDREHLIAKYEGSNGKRIFRLYLHGSTLRFGVGYNSGNSSVEITHSMTGLLEHWNHYAATFDGGVMKLYVNGVLVTNTDNSGTLTAIHANNAIELEIGAYQSGSHTWTGQMADVRIYNAVLTDANIQFLASKINTDKSLGAGTTNLKGYWKLNNETASGGGSGTGFVVDESGTVNQGTLTNFSGTYWDYDAYSVDVYDNSTTTDGTFTVTQGKVEGKGLSMGHFDGSNDFVSTSNAADLSFGDGSNDSPFTFSAWIRMDDATHFVVLAKESEYYFRTFSDDKLYLGIYDNSTSGEEFAHTTSTITSHENNWIHVTGTYNGAGGTSANAGMSLYINGVSQAVTLGDSGSHTAMEDSADNMLIGASSKGTARYSDGEIRDVKLFDYELSAEQVASMYSNTYPQTPYHHYKLDEGSGTVATDSGTATQRDGFMSGATYTNGTLDLDGGLTIAAKGFLSAPRGSLEVATLFDNNGDNNYSFIHNNGTVKFAHSSAMDVLGGSATARGARFYNVQDHPSDSTEIINWQENATIEKDWDINGKSRIYGNIFLGTEADTSSMTVNTGARLQLYGGKFTGNSVLYPAVFTGDGIDYESSAGFEVSNIDWSAFSYTTSNNITLTLEGDCKFGALTIGSGATLDLNGQRAVFGGTLTNNGNIDYDGLVFLDGGINDDGSATNVASCKMIFSTNTGTTDISGSGVGLMMINHPSFATSFTGGRMGTTTIVGSGEYRLAGGTSTVTDLTIATGGELDDRDSGGTVTCSGDFTTSGGLLGASAITLDGTDQHYSTVSAVAVGTNSAWTIEGWMKRDSGVSGNEVFVELKTASDNNNRVWFNIDTDDVQMLIYSNGGSMGLAATANQGLNDGKWHHVACTYDSTTAKIYIDGKLTTSEVISKTVDNTDDRIINIGANVGTYGNGFTGSIDEVRIWSDVRTEAEIRANMFSEVSSGDGLVQNWRFNDGTGDSASANVGNTLLARVGSNSASSQSASLWAAGGTFTKGTDSTVNMTNADGKMYLGSLGYSFENLGLAPSGGTTTLTKVGGHGTLRVYKTLTHNGGTFAQSGNMNTEINGVGTVSAGASIPYICYWGSSTNVPSATFQYFIANTGTVTLAGNGTFTGYLRTGAYKIFTGAFSHSVRTLSIDTNGIMDLSNSTITMTGTTSSTNFNDPNSTLLSGNTTIIGHASNTYWLSPAAAGHEIVGNVSNLLGMSGNDLTIIGSVTNCTGEGFRQWHHTLDTQQLLDADEAGDDDLRLTKPALDNALELMTK